MNKNLRTSDEGTSYCALCEKYARENERLRNLLKGCVLWIEPVLAGFEIPDDAKVRLFILNPAKKALATEVPK